ncbi:MAG: PQQ-binding-like beta-propeller repeat protein [Bacteroidales bacterium]
MSHSQVDSIPTLKNSNFNETDSLKTKSDSVEVIIPTFLGNKQRNYYGSDPPDALEIKWKRYLGKGKTVISRNIGEKEWKGAGWTGQPLLVKEKEELYLIQGAYDHNLKKINASNGEIAWEYNFDDVIKGTGTIWYKPEYPEAENRLVILQGSRLGTDNYLDSKHIPSYRAVSYFTGRELWRHDVKWTHSYSRDVDGSALIHQDTVYIGFENSFFTVLNPDYKKAQIRDSMLQPEIQRQIRLYEMEDVKKHDHNVVTESSPSLLNDRIYVASGSGHVYGYNLQTGQLDWDFYIGSDIDGSAVVTSDSCLMVSVEKQYIKGKGGAFKLDPSKEPENSVLWYHPTDSTDLLDWEGGIIGSIGINDNYVKKDQKKLAAFTGLDGYLYVVSHQELQPGKEVLGPDSLSHYPTPRVVYKRKVGPSISTPVFYENKLLVATYNGLYLFEYDRQHNFVLKDKFNAPFEATPIAYNGCIYIASRNGYLYCFYD